MFSCVFSFVSFKYILWRWRITLSIIWLRKMHFKQLKQNSGFSSFTSSSSGWVSVLLSPISFTNTLTLYFRHYYFSTKFKFTLKILFVKTKSSAKTHTEWKTDAWIYNIIIRKITQVFFGKYVVGPKKFVERQMFEKFSSTPRWTTYGGKRPGCNGKY
jgi:hypothetical protein